MMTLKQSCFISAVLLLSSCLQEPELDLGTPPQKLVLNGLLHPSQHITVRLSLPGGFADTAFVPVTGAEVSLWENGQPLGNLQEQGEGVYKLDLLPKPGNSYRITAKAEGLPVVEAEDVVPYKVTLQYDSVSKFVNDYWVRDLIISNPSIGIEYFWLWSARNDYKYIKPTGQLGYYDSTTLVWSNQGAACIRTFIPQLNREEFYYFNDEYSTTPQFYYCSVYPMMRLNDEASPASEIRLEQLISQYFDYEASQGQEIGHFNKRGFYNVLLSASEHYDRYLRSSLLYHENFERFSDPNLVATPAPIHSNVQGGFGIFAGFNTDTLFITDEF